MTSQPAAPEHDAGIEIIQIRYGERRVSRSTVFLDYESYGLPDSELLMDYNFWVLRDGATVILLDTGYNITAHDWLGEVSVEPVPQGLALVGIEPADVSMVITSHFHYDHIGFLHLFSDAEIVAGADEHAYWLGKLERGELENEYTLPEYLEPVKKAEREGRLRLISGATVLHPGVTVHQVGGHCPGQLVTVVESRSGDRILAVDAAHFYEQIEHGWPFFAYTDLADMRQAFAFMNELAARTGAIIVPGHDGRVRERFPALPGPAARIATVLG